MTSEILHVKLTQVYYIAVWMFTSITSIKYLFSVQQFLALVMSEGNQGLSRKSSDCKNLSSFEQKY